MSKRTEEFLISLFEVSAPSASRGNSVTAVELLQQAGEAIERDLDDEPQVREHLMQTVEQARLQLGLTEEEGRDAE